MNKKFLKKTKTISLALRQSFLSCQSFAQCKDVDQKCGTMFNSKLLQFEQGVQE